MLSKGTVIYIGNFEMPDKNAAAHRVLNISKILVNIGYKVVFCGIDKSISKDSDVINNFDGFESCPRKYPTNVVEWYSFFTNFSNIKKILDRYKDIKYVFVYNMHSIPMYYILKYCRKNNIKIVADITEWYDNYLSINPIKLIKWLDTAISMRYLNKKADGIISISKYLNDYYLKCKCKTIILPPLVDSKEKIWKNEILENTNTISFIYTGNPGNNKDKLYTIIKCFAELNLQVNYKFIIAGINKEQLVRESIKSSDYINNLGDHIEFVGIISHEKSISYLLKSDYCIFFRDRMRKNQAGFPTKFVECVTSGIGIITNKFSNIEDYFPIENSILLEDSSEESIKKGILFAINNGKVVHKGQNIFDYHICINKIADFLKIV